jgi:hypothetical protein
VQCIESNNPQLRRDAARIVIQVIHRHMEEQQLRPFRMFFASEPTPFLSDSLIADELDILLNNSTSSFGGSYTASVPLVTPSASFSDVDFSVTPMQMRIQRELNSNSFPSIGGLNDICDDECGEKITDEGHTKKDQIEMNKNEEKIIENESKLTPTHTPNHETRSPIQATQTLTDILPHSEDLIIDGEENEKGKQEERDEGEKEEKPQVHPTRPLRPQRSSSLTSFSPLSHNRLKSPSMTDLDNPSYNNLRVSNPSPPQLDDPIIRVRPHTSIPGIVTQTSHLDVPQTETPKLKPKVYSRLPVPLSTLLFIYRLLSPCVATDRYVGLDALILYLGCTSPLERERQLKYFFFLYFYFE